MVFISRLEYLVNATAAVAVGSVKKVPQPVALRALGELLDGHEVPSNDDRRGMSWIDASRSFLTMPRTHETHSRKSIEPS